MSIKKQYIKNRTVCKVSFKLPKETINSATMAHVVGEFNGWDTHATPMKRLKNGSFTATIDLEAGREYQFRYLLDDKNWKTDFEADSFTPTPFGKSENSILIV